MKRKSKLLPSTKFVFCHSCGQKRKTSGKSYFVRLEHSPATIVMEKDSSGKWTCSKGFGCSK